MCGIAGYFLPRGMAEQARVRAMCGRIRHRGPDDEGVHVDGGCGIGMRRLSIIDLSTGHQPIGNEDSTVWVVFNGEIYNYQELRQELIAKGHRFRTNSDTETLVHLYEEEGAAGIARLRGMFAYAIWDGRRRRLLLARDRFGKKPLYCAIRPEGIYFGSELKCLREFDLPFELDQEALRLYFQFRFIPDPQTPFVGVFKLAPGGWLQYEESGQWEQRAYWKAPQPRETAESGWTRQQAAAEVRERFDESVRVRLMADVPLGAFLSGGIDSSSVVASMALRSQEPVKTFSIGFEEASHSELPFARMVADRYKTEHHEIVVRPEAIDLVQRLVRHFDEPFGDSSAIPTFIVSEFAARHVKVALTGDGGDELFGGYRSFFQVNDLRWADRIPGVLKTLTAWVAERLPYSAYGKNWLHMISRPTPLERYFAFNYPPYFQRQRLLQPAWMLPADGAYLWRRFAECLAGGDADVLTQAMYFESTVNLTGDMLVKVDRMSMANSLEVRSPLMDHELAALAARIPHAWKMRGGQGKAIFLDAVGDRLPREIFDRPKMGFGVPLALWFRGPLRDFLWDHLLSRESLDRGMVSEAFLKEILEEHQAGRRDNSHTLWSLLMLELWFRDWNAELGRSGAVSERGEVVTGVRG